MHNEMVEIFYSRQQEKTLVDDEFGTKNLSTNKIQSSFQEISSKKIQQDAEISAKMLNSLKIYDQKNKTNLQNEDNQLNLSQINNEISYFQFKNTSNLEPENTKQDFKCQLQDSLSIYVQNDNKKFVCLDNLENKESQQHIQNLNCSTQNLNTVIGSPYYRNNPLNSQYNTPKLMNQESIDGQKTIYQFIGQSKTQQMEDKQNNLLSSQKENNNVNLQNPLEAKSLNVSFKLGIQNQNSGGGVLESPHKKQKQILSSLHMSKKRESRKVTGIDKQSQKKQNNFFHILMKMKNYAYKMASNIESKRLTLLQRQKFFYLRDKTINYDNQQKGDFEFYDYNYLQRMINIIFRQANSISIIKKIRKNIPKIPLFLPQSIFKFIWDILNMIIVIIFFFYLPLYFIYGIQFSEVFYFRSLDIILASIATLDILVKLNTVQYKKGNLLHSRTLIMLEYISKDGLLNISFVIVLWINVSSQRNFFQLFDDYKINILFFLVALFKVFKQNSFKNRIYDRFYLRKMNRGFISLMQIFFNLLIVSHIFACTWLVVGKIHESQPCGFQGFSYSNNNNCSFSWLDKLQGVNSLKFYEQYLRAYYFATVTMITVGYGDIVPVNSREYLLSILTMLIACGMFGYSLNSIGQILSEMNTNNKEYDEHFNAIYGFMHKKNVSIDLQVQVREYLQYFFIQSNQEDIQKQQKVISLLPESLQNQIMLEANKIVFEKSPLFSEEKNQFIHNQLNRKNFSQQIIQKTIKLIDQKEFRPGQKIITQDEENDYCIYFIEKGSVEIYNSNNNEELKVLRKGDYFGEIQFFTGKESQLSVRSVEFTKVLVIKRSSFYELIQSSPIDLERFCMIKDSIIFNNKLDQVGVTCYCCKSTNHLVTQCNFIHLCSDKLKIIKEYAKNDFQTRDKDIQRKSSSYNSLQLRHQIEEGAKQFVEENSEDLGWLNDMTQQEYEEDRDFIKNDRRQPSLRTIGHQQNMNYFQKMKSQQYVQSQLQNIKLQYQISKNVMDNQNMNVNPDFNDKQGVYLQQKSNNNFDRQSLQVQQKSNNNFQYSINYDDFCCSSHNACAQCKKVYFSIKSLQDKLVDEDQGDIKSQQTNMGQNSQYVLNQASNINHNIIQGEGNTLNTPTNRPRQLSNLSEMCPSPFSASNKLYVNANTPICHHQTLNPQPSTGFYIQNPQNTYNSVPEFLQPSSSLESNQLTNQDNYTQFSNKNKIDENKFYNKQINQQKSFNQNENLKEQYVQKNSAKTEATFMRKSQNRQPTKQLSSMFQKQANEALLRQLKEFFQQPQKQNQEDYDFQFETLKSYQLYMPQNNYERVILLYSVHMRKNLPQQQLFKTVKSIPHKSNENDANQKPQNTKNIQYYQDLIKQNQSEQISEENQKSQQPK